MRALSTPMQYRHKLRQLVYDSLSSFRKVIIRVIQDTEADETDKLRKWLQDTREEAKAHISPALLDTYIFHRNELDTETCQDIEEHVRACERCRKQVEEGEKHFAFFMRQKGYCD